MALQGLLGLSSERCEGLSSPSIPNFAVSLFIFCGIVISYLPQHYRIIARKSSEGISPYFVLLGTTSGTFAFATVLAQPSSREDLACCKEISDFACFAAILGVLQVGVQWLCFVIILLLFFLFFPRATSTDLPNVDKAVAPSFSTALIIVFVCIVHGFVAALLNLFMVYKEPEYLQSYANTIGILATILASIQYLPQIWTTWRLKHVGSLSIPMMCLQTPGSFLWAGSLAARMGWAGWSTWGLFCITGILQGVILVMGIVFELRKRRKQKETEPLAPSEVGGTDTAPSREEDETTPLLRNES